MRDYATLFDSQPSAEELAAAFDGFEADITYIDDHDVVVYYSPFRIFNRPESCLGENVYDCHPAEAHAAVQALLEGFRSGKQDRVSHDDVAVGDRLAKVCYHAMHDRAGTYLGCMEVATYRN